MKSLLIALISLPVFASAGLADTYVNTRNDTVFQPGQNVVIQTYNAGYTYSRYNNFVEAEAGVGHTLTGDREFLVNAKVSAGQRLSDNLTLRGTVEPIWFTESEAVSLETTAELRYNF